MPATRTAARRPATPLLALAPLAVLALAGPIELRAQRTSEERRAIASRAIPPAKLDSIRARVRHLMDSAKVPSVAIAVAKDGLIIWEEAFGYADVERRVAATPRTLYSMASISKPIAATGLMKLVEQGKVDLDRPANDYLGAGKITGLAGDASGATVRRLLAHTAGLPLHYRFFYEGGKVARPSMDEAISRYANVVFPPGAVYNYSNLGYGVIEEIIAKASGRSFEDFMRDEVFVPLGMPTTTIGTGAGLANAALRYYPGDKPVAAYDFDHRAASAVYTSAHELVRFGIFHLGHRLRDQKPILTDASLRAMQRVETPGDTTQGYGLGWAIGREQGTKVVSHTGGMPGVSTTLKLYPAHDVAIAVLANASGGAVPHRVIFHVAGAVIPGYDGEAEERRIMTSTPTPFAAPAELQGVWSGTIRSYDGTTSPISLLVKSDDVHVRLGDGTAMWTVLNGPTFRNRLLGGRFAGTIPSEEAKRFPHNVALSLLVDGATMRGYAAALTTDEPLTGAMSSYVELRKAGAGTR